MVNNQFTLCQKIPILKFQVLSTMMTWSICSIYLHFFRSLRQRTLSRKWLKNSRSCLLTSFRLGRYFTLWYKKAKYEVQKRLWRFPHPIKICFLYGCMEWINWLIDTYKVGNLIRLVVIWIVIVISSRDIQYV
jgi:hypothetical protein